MLRNLLGVTLGGILLGAASLGTLWAAAKAEPARGNANVAANRQRANKLTPLYKTLGKPAPGDWLAQHPEHGQTFDEYRSSNPNRPSRQHTAMYIQPIGDFTPVQEKILADTSDFLGKFYSVPVKKLPAVTLADIPDKAKRVHPTWGDKQLLTTYILNDLLKPQRPQDAVAVLALTASDLWPGENWNFVFGQANLTERVGVWSLYRNGDPEDGDDAYALCLRRTLKTAVHETGHMLGMAHCTAFACGMNGSNSRAESDHQPLWFCPQCEQKVWWSCGGDPVQRLRTLGDYAAEHKLGDEAEFCRECLRVLENRE